MPGAGRSNYGVAVRNRLVDLGVAAIPLLLGLLGPARHGIGWSLPLSLAYSVPLYWRRRYPRAVLAATFAAGLVQLTAAVAAGPMSAIARPDYYDLGIIIAIYAAVAYGTRWTRLLAVVVGTAGAAAGAVLWLGPRMTASNYLTGLCALFAPVLLAWAIGTTARTRHAYLAGLVERAERLEREREALALVAVAQERERIARELHDIVAHGVSLMVVQSDGAEAAIRQQNMAEVSEAITTIGRAGRDALTELRLLLGMLRSEHEIEGPQPGTDQLEDLIASVPARVRLSIEGPQRELPRGLALAVFRIVQEALTNTIKHAGPDASADVRLSYRNTALEVEVSDDGRGMASQDATGHGLIGMRERVAMFGGTLTAGPRPAGGFRVRALLPWA
jgi:signal transduction histidine kinase